jgi:hypothetical protein
MICAACEGTGQCRLCAGQSTIRCVACNGLGHVRETCPRCGGTPPTAAPAICSDCQGSGKVDTICEDCNGVGNFLCQQCRGGKQCRTCSGTGQTLALRDRRNYAVTRPQMPSVSPGGRYDVESAGKPMLLSTKIASAETQIIPQQLLVPQSVLSLRSFADFTSDPTVPDWEFFVKRTVGETVVIYCASASLDPSQLVDPNKDLSIFAETLTIQGAIALPGRKVTIHARTIISNNASISVSGTDGNDSNPGKRADDGPSGAVPGAAGERGKNGGDAQAGGIAGDLTIVAGTISGNLSIFANGGHGGRGQDGGNGGVGALGLDGSSGNADGRCGDGGSGHRGGDGGAAGIGGRGGGGGNAGRVVVRTLDPIPWVEGCEQRWRRR